MKIYDFQGKKNICGEHLKEARKAMKLTQAELADEMQKRGITLERDSISRIEIGTRFISDYELLIFSQILERDINYFYGISSGEEGATENVNLEGSAQETTDAPTGDPDSSGDDNSEI